jgi:dTDP-4-dehydrorhamnose 3,5-epimerase
MKKIATSLLDVFILEPRVFSDSRGYFLESYNARVLRELGIDYEFVQDNQSYSVRNVVRGLHYQVRQPQGKLVRVLTGEILDVVVDLKENSPTYGKWEAVSLTAENKRMLWIPPGFAHGFRVVSAEAQALYKATDFYCPGAERTILWNDPDLSIDWGLDGEAIVSEKDRNGVPFATADALVLA